MFWIYKTELNVHSFSIHRPALLVDLDFKRTVRFMSEESVVSNILSHYYASITKTHSDTLIGIKSTEPPRSGYHQCLGPWQHQVIRLNLHYPLVISPYFELYLFTVNRRRYLPKQS